VARLLASPRLGQRENANQTAPIVRMTATAVNTIANVALCSFIISVFLACVIAVGFRVDIAYSTTPVHGCCPKVT